MAELQAEVSELQAEVGKLQVEVGELQEEVGGLQTRTEDAEEGAQRLQERLGEELEGEHSGGALSRAQGQKGAPSEDEAEIVKATVVLEDEFVCEDDSDDKERDHY
ncbi:hypothetical protein BOTBODRAFT_178839 [Botryobasidium botryosum FD-172 SS1]|uniref:Uncharacterized protein n=1 Tax=Botryobasidium botryosum (strain FD-172 SS1) TaxID=930990 RepID=A0A067MDE0_BOTB1|nr:hypothetical protein BOTBODRAFT_178839 [Botryobasidium botryosum FD-172 SS1]